MFSDEIFAGFGTMGGTISEGFFDELKPTRLLRERAHEARVKERVRDGDSIWGSGNAIDAPHITHFDQLIKEGVDLPYPNDVDEKVLATKLWEVIHALAGLRVFLRHTDHLSDRELYELLWWDFLRQETLDTTALPEMRCKLDILGDRNGEQLYLYLKFYAEEQERRLWSEQYPDSPLPTHLDPPFRRDKSLPNSF